MQPIVIRIDGVIGTGPNEVSAQMVREQLPVNGTEPIEVKIHSEGGNVFEGFAIHDAFAAYQGPKSLSIESSAFSIASFIAMAFDDVSISQNGYMMLHNPYMAVEGDDEDLAASSQVLAQLKASAIAAYQKRSGKTEEEIKAIMKAETFLNAEQSVAMGFATRIANQSVIGRPFAKLTNLPHGVVAALFGAGSGGNQEPLTKVKPMSDSAPVAATLQEIEAAFPKAKAEFVIKCLKKSMPMASVAQAAVEEMLAENEMLRAQIKSMEDEKAKAELPMEEEEPSAEMPMEEEPEAKATAQARGGVKPIAKAKTSGPSARVRWSEAINTKVAAGIPRAKAILAIEKEQPELRAAMLAEVNAR